jgi:hypothetical protein
LGEPRRIAARLVPPIFELPRQGRSRLLMTVLIDVAVQRFGPGENELRPNQNARAAVPAGAKRRIAFRQIQDLAIRVNLSCRPCRQRGRARNPVSYGLVRVADPAARGSSARACAGPGISTKSPQPKKAFADALRLVVNEDEVIPLFVQAVPQLRWAKDYRRIRRSSLRPNRRSCSLLSRR